MLNLMRKRPLWMGIATAAGLWISSAMGANPTLKEMEGYYRWPVYPSAVREGMHHFLKGGSFLQWDYGHIYDRVPALYAEKMHTTYGFFCNSGTSALHAALMALGLKRGDRVVVPAMTFIRSVTPLVHMGLEPVLVDIDPDHGNLLPEALVKIDDTKIKAVIVVHMWGVPAPMEPILSIAKRKNWKVIEDFSHAHYSQVNHKFVGSMGDIGVASMQRKKIIALGEGGLITTQHRDIHERVRTIVSPGSYDNPKDTIDHSGYGLNMRMAPTSVVIAEHLYPSLDWIIDQRNASANMLRSMLQKYPDIFDIAPLPTHATRVNWYALRLRVKADPAKLIEVSRNSRWQWSGFDYPSIAQHRFWKKNKAYFPWSDNVRIVNPSQKFPGMERYLEGRMSLKIPRVTAWTNQEKKLWESELEKIVEALRQPA